MPTLLSDVRCWVNSGKHLLAASISPPGTDFIYFAFVNYTTLGYGDVTPIERWHLLGPMTAMNGVLLFGWSTAVIFAVLRAVMTSQTEEGTRQKGVSSE
jgi:ion channel